MSFQVRLFIVLLCTLSFVSLASSLCEDITGYWVDNLGSEISIDHLKSGELRGQYHSAVSLTATGLPGHELVGALPYNKSGSSFAFSVTWENGTSTTVWTGQCLVCDGKELLETSWLLRSLVDSCDDRWKSTRIGKTEFSRKTGSPHSKVTSTNKKFGEESKSCDLNGIWYNDVGSEMILNRTSNGLITGEYRTAVEREKGSAGTTHSPIYGLSASGDGNATFSLMVVWRNGASVTGFVGQCHICENNTVVLESAWLLRSAIENCDDIWKTSMYGVNMFTRHEQKQGPRKSLGTHTPNRNGEDGDTGGSSSFVPSRILLGLALFPISFLLLGTGI